MVCCNVILKVQPALPHARLDSQTVPLRAGMQHVNALARNVSGLMDGSWNPDPSQHGLNTEEERVSSSAPIVRHHG